MKKQTETLLSEAIDLVDGADHVLANTLSQYDLSAKNCYDLAEKLERARNLLLVVGDRKNFSYKITSKSVMSNYYRRSPVLKIPQGGRYKIRLYFIFMRKTAILGANFGGIDYHI